MDDQINQKSVALEVLTGLGVLAILLALVALVLYFLRYYIATTIVGTVAASMLIGVGLALTWFIASSWTVKTMSAGADIALKAQATNDKWDAQKTNALAHLMQTGAKIGRDSAPGFHPSDQKLLPLPGDDLSWLPALTDFNAPVDADFTTEP